jgi:hypothetical protein
VEKYVTENGKPGDFFKSANPLIFGKSVYLADWQKWDLGLSLIQIRKPYPLHTTNFVSPLICGLATSGTS